MSFFNLGKLGDIKDMIDTDDTGEDMRGCKRLVSDHTAAEAELGAVEQKVAGLSFLVFIYIFCFQGRRPLFFGFYL